MIDNVVMDLVNQLKYQIPLIIMGLGENAIYAYASIAILFVLYKSYQPIKKYYYPIPQRLGVNTNVSYSCLSEFVIKHYPSKIKNLYTNGNREGTEEQLGDLTGIFKHKTEILVDNQHQIINCCFRDIYEKEQYKPDKEIIDIKFDIVFNNKTREVKDSRGNVEHVTENDVCIQCKRPDLLPQIYDYIYNLQYYNRKKNQLIEKGITYVKYNYDEDQNNDYSCKRRVTKINKKFSNIFLSVENEKAIVTYSTNFFKDKEFYNTKGISNKLGYLYYGSPGEGKSSTILALANEHKLEIHFMDLNQFTNESFLSACSYISDAVVVFEELDTFKVAHKRKTADEESKILTEDEMRMAFYTEFKKEKDDDKKKKERDEVSFETILMVLDGYYHLNNCIIVITTNHLDKIDPAIYRKGRIDHLIEFKKCTRYQLEKMFKLYFNDDLPESYQFTDNIISTSEIINSIFMPNLHNETLALKLLFDRVEEIRAEQCK
jgi:hypothetical protein